MKTYYLPDCKSRGKLQEKEVRILGTGSVFLYGFSGCNVNQVDGEVWNFEAAGSNPATQTSFWKYSTAVVHLLHTEMVSSSNLLTSTNI